MSGICAKNDTGDISDKLTGENMALALCTGSPLKGVGQKFNGLGSREVCEGKYSPLADTGVAIENEKGYTGCDIKSMFNDGGGRLSLKARHSRNCSCSSIAFSILPNSNYLFISNVQVPDHCM